MAWYLATRRDNFTFTVSFEELNMHFHRKQFLHTFLVKRNVLLVRGQCIT
jgi:hypothetical protein